ncbi:PucR family transcriptional regulator ligand-binding domain-containing protein [Ruminococcaceae bacterium OttesenSCG-928-I18]|nr:PucR family transcriptional regulator ligand-binding domain-containing protein [Ruminococcaceae bacterium OttesenSCG-928-I18]
MQPTLRKLLESEEFTDYYVISGAAGLDHPVSTVSVMDAPDIYEWMRGGEILITTGYLFRDNLEYISFLIERLKEANAAALFVKLGRFIDEMPQNAIETSEKLGFPLVYMPIDFAFIDVINPVLSKIISAQSEAIRYSNSIHKVFTDIAILGQGIQEVVSAISGLIQSKVVYYDTFRDELYQDDTHFELETFKRRFLEDYTCFPVHLENRTYGYIVITEEDYTADEYSDIVVEHASTIIKLEIQKKISNLQIERKYRDQFVQDILFQNIKSGDEVEKRGRVFSWQFEGSYRVFIIDIDHFKAKYIHGLDQNDRRLDTVANEIFETSISFLRRRFSHIIYTTFSDQTVVIAREPVESPDTKAAFATAAHELQEKISAAHFEFSLSLAFGDAHEGILSASTGYKEAKRALQLAHLYGTKNRIVFYEDLGLYTLLDAIRDDSSLREYSGRTLSPLLQYQSKKGNDLLDTLQTLIDCNWNMKKASLAMYLHYNTLKQRYHKIEQILGVDFDRVSDRVNIELAVKHHRLLSSGE